MSKFVFSPTVQELHNRIHDLPENFKEFIQSECNWEPCQYFSLLKHPEQCSPENLKVIFKIASDLVHDLQVLITYCKQTLLEHKTQNHEIK